MIRYLVQSAMFSEMGAGATIGVVMAIFIGIVYFIMNRLLKDDDLEY